jgi:hypothetical protein
MDATGTTAYNRPHQPCIQYSAKGYDQYRTDLLKRLEANGFVLRDDDFIQAFIDLTAYLGEVLMTYQNAYSQEIFLETAQMRESLFNFAAMVDYRVDPGSAATGTLVILVQPNKSGLLPQGFQVSGKDENAKKAVFFETDAPLAVNSLYNDFTLAAGERHIQLEIGNSLTLLDKVVIRSGDHFYFHSTAGDFFAQVQSSSINEPKGTTTVTWADTDCYQTYSGNVQVGSGSWGLLNSEAHGLLNLSNSSQTLYLDGKYENIAESDPLILKKKGATDCYGLITKIESEIVKIKTGMVRWISQSPANSSNDEAELYHYTIRVKDGSSNVDRIFYALEKTLSEVKEVTKLTLKWLGGVPNGYSYSTGINEKSPLHSVYAGLGKTFNVQDQTENQTLLNGAQTLLIDGDMSGLERDRLWVLHQELSSGKAIEEVNVKEVVYDPVTKKSYVDLHKAINHAFTKYGVRIWGNGVKITQGKSVAETVLGSGQGEQLNQSFDLPQSPLTYERQGRAGIIPAITIKLDDLVWKQREDFMTSGPRDRDFIVQTGYDGQSRVVFGDGVKGSRTPTGRDNVKAQFRIGLGQEGNVSADVLKKPTLKPPFVKETFNSEQTAGGSDPAKEEELRAKIPLEHLTFDRAVSLSDYADLALSYPCISKAKAGWRWQNSCQFVCLAVSGQNGTDPTPLLEDLRAYLDARRDTNQPLLVEKVNLVPIAISLEAIAGAEYDPDQIKSAIIKALGTGINTDGSKQFFNFDRLRIGMSIHQKDIHQLITGIPGVSYISHLELMRSDPCPNSLGYMTPAYCSQDIWINNWELAGLDKATLDVMVSQTPINKVCQRSGG